MQLLLTIPDAAAPDLLQHLRTLGASWSFVVPDAPAEAPKTVKRPTIPRHVAGEMREAFAEIKAARNGGLPLMTEEQFWAAFHADTDANDDAI